MMYLSKKLIEKGKAYFSKRFQREVNEEETEQYLISLAHLYDLFTSVEKKS